MAGPCESTRLRTGVTVAAAVVAAVAVVDTAVVAVDMAAAAAVAVDVIANGTRPADN